MVQNALAAEIERMDEAIEWAKAGLTRAPQGKLLMDKQKGSVRYYWRKDSTDKKGTYLGKDGGELDKLNRYAAAG